MPDSIAPGQLVSLTPQQQVAIRHLAEGKSIAVAAEQAGVHRGTLHRWVTTDPAFKAAFNTWQHELRTSTRARLLVLCDRAVDTLAVALDKADAKTALNILRYMAMLTPPEPGPTDPAEVHAYQVLDDRNRAADLGAAETETVFKELKGGVRHEPQLGLLPDHLTPTTRPPRNARRLPKAPDDLLSLPAMEDEGSD